MSSDSSTTLGLTVLMRIPRGDVGACSVGKCLKAGVKSRCNHRLFYRLLGQDAGDESERTTVSKVVQSVHHKVDLPVQLVIEPCLEVLVCASLRYTNGAEPKVAIIALNEPAWLKNSFTEATSVMSMPGEELRELDKVRVANDMVVIEGILGDESGERMAQLDEVLQEYLSRMDKPDPIERHAAHMAFHRGVGETSGNTFMMKLWPVLEARMTLVLAVEQEQRHDYSRAYALHESLGECIRRGDRDEIYENLRMHVVGSAEESLETSTPNLR